MFSCNTPTKENQSPLVRSPSLCCCFWTCTLLSSFGLQHHNRSRKLRINCRWCLSLLPPRKHPVATRHHRPVLVSSFQITSMSSCLKETLWWRRWHFLTKQRATMPEAQSSPGCCKLKVFWQAAVIEKHIAAIPFLSGLFARCNQYTVCQQNACQSSAGFLQQGPHTSLMLKRSFQIRKDFPALLIVC